MRKVSLVLFVVSMFFASCSKDDTTDPGNNQQQNDDKNDDKDDDKDDDQGAVSIVSKWTAGSITVSGEQKVEYNGLPITAIIEGAATDATVGKVTYEFTKGPDKVISSGKFDIEIKVSAMGAEVHKETLKDQVFGVSGDWTLSDDGKTVTIKDVATGENVVMGVVLTEKTLKLTGKVVKEFEYDGKTYSPVLDLVAEFTR